MTKSSGLTDAATKIVYLSLILAALVFGAPRKIDLDIGRGLLKGERP